MLSGKKKDILISVRIIMLSYEIIYCEVVPCVILFYMQGIFVSLIEIISSLLYCKNRFIWLINFKYHYMLSRMFLLSVPFVLTRNTFRQSHLQNLDIICHNELFPVFVPPGVILNIIISSFIDFMFFFSLFFRASETFLLWLVTLFLILHRADFKI